VPRTAPPGCRGILLPAMLTSVLAIAIGAALGAIVRWLLALGLNGLFPTLPPGTLAANLIGGYLIGLALGVFAQHPEVPSHWRLFVVTGFLGGLTTFSAFSAEVTHLLQQGRLLWAGATISAHVAGSLAATLLGLASATLLARD
jgi:fluoride exporter